MNLNWKIIGAIIAAGVAAAGLIIWVVYYRTPTLNPVQTPNSTFGTSDTRTTTGVTPSQESEALPVVTQVPGQTIFKITDGPVAGATLVTTTNPTSTIARFVLATNGHTFDLLLDSPGAIPKAISNTTIPGIVNAAWSQQGRGVLLQYLDQETTKTAHLALPPPAATTSPVRIQFLPSNISSLAVSPDGANVGYLVRTASGSDGYTSRADGASAKKLFSLPLSHIQLLWPAQTTLLAQSASAAGVAGVVFSINSATGAAAPLIYAPGITATADRSFSRVVYQTAAEDTRVSYSQDLKTGLSRRLSFNPIPELCVWSLATSTVMYCAVPLSYVEPNYLDLLHFGVDGGAMSIVSFDLATGRSTVVSTPGGSEGGEAASIAQLSVSPREDYLLFVRKGDRSLWAVRLSK